MNTEQEGTPRGKRNRRSGRVKVSATVPDWCRGPGLRCCGSSPRTRVWLRAGRVDTYKTLPTVHMPGRLLADLAVMIADGGDALSHLATLRDQDKLFGAVAS
jgi:hypothetical protein